MSAATKQLNAAWFRRLRSRVLRWYDQHGRTLPWRESADPYRIWLSEIMLQQTTVAAVVPYFDRFVEQFPDVCSLAEADQDQVLRQWEGLGYYSRARNLHKAARVVVTDHDGRLPETVDELRKLPGIGPYTAAAIASFAFGQPAGILEANTLRLYSRLMLLETDPHSAEGQKQLWKFANRVVSRKRAGDFNQGAMDIGAQVCRPADPDCPHCPLMASCRAFEHGRQRDIPIPKERPQMTDITEVAVALQRNDRYLLRQRRADERWAGLWDFVRFEINENNSDGMKKLFVRPRTRRKTKHATQQKTLFTVPEKDTAEFQLPDIVRQQVALETGLDVTSGLPLKEIRHTVTRYRIRLLCLQVRSVTGQVKGSSDYRWFSSSELNELPLSVAGRKLANLLCSSES